MLTSVVIPTFRRPDYLTKALHGLSQQRQKVDQIVIGVRDGDSTTIDFLANLQGDLPIEVVYVKVPGVIASMNAAIQQTTGEIVCLLDDDAEPLPNWIEKIARLFAEHPKLGAVGGRDLLQDHPEMRREESTTESVGIFTKFGRIIGNHHRGHGPFRKVDLFKGCNAAVRGSLIREIGLDTRLLGKGAQVHWELALCLDIASRGFFVAYDPSVQIIHHIAPRLDDDLIHRGKFSRQGLYDLVYNEHFVIHSRVHGTQRILHFLWSIVIGSLAAPGMVQYLRGKLKREKNMEQRLRATLRATLDGKKAALRS